MNEVAKAYVAAMIDGEGVITFSRQRCKPGRNGREWKFSPLVLVTNSHLGLISFLKEVSGSGIVYSNKAPAQDNWSIIHRWQVLSRQATLLLHEVRPYLIVKADLADAVLAFPLQSRGGRRPEDAEIYTQQLTLFDRVRSMNVRGRKEDRDLASFPADHPALLK